MATLKLTLHLSQNKNMKLISPLTYCDTVSKNLNSHYHIDINISLSKQNIVYMGYNVLIGCFRVRAKKLYPED